MPRIFFSYRHNDNYDFVHRIADQFANLFGDDSVFIDSKGIAPAAVWSEVIEKQIEKCDVMVVIIGTKWVSLLHTSEDDIVYREITTALDNGKLIVPVCIKDASVPQKKKLPVRLHPILDRQIARIDDRHFDLDCKTLMDSIEQELQVSNSSPRDASRVTIKTNLEKVNFDENKLIDFIARLVGIGVDEIEIIDIAV